MAKQIRVGICGLGFMGKMHFDTYKAMKGVKVTAIADVDPKKRKGDWSAIGGNIEAKGKGPDLKGIAMYGKPEDLFKDENVDVIDITLPTYLHAQYAVKALKTGKPTICEKPMAIKSAEAKRMADTAVKTRTPLFLGHCIRFWPEYAKAKDLVDKKTYGKALQATFTRLSLTPSWSWKNWIVDPKRGGGAGLDLHIHDVDFVQYLFGKPSSVSATMASLKGNAPDHVVANYFWKNNKSLSVTAEGGWMYAPGFGFTMNFRINCEKATIVFDVAEGMKIHTKSGKTLTPKVARGDGYSRELEYFIDCIKKNRKPKVVTPQSSVMSVKMVEAEVKSARSGGKPVAIPAR
jgi:1,5-anhydro-D-fructose reductase (1,5-anhydro-D-mannitol-forming)